MDSIVTPWASADDDQGKRPTSRFIAYTLLIALAGTICDGYGAGKLALGLLSNEPGKNSSAFACCTSKTCDYEAPPFAFLGAPINPTQIHVNERGICVGPPNVGAIICDGSQVPANVTCSPADLESQFALMENNSLLAAYFKIACIVFGIFVFVYLIWSQGIEWHKTGDKNCCFCPEDKEIELSCSDICETAIW
jgi:hypothetical protein